MITSIDGHSGWRRRTGVDMTGAFDPMAVAIDWLDAYRASRLDAMLNLYDDEACIECGCGGQTVLVGKPALKEYWKHRLAEQALLELEDIQPVGDTVALAYRTATGQVQIVFSFSASGRIARTHCGPTMLEAFEDR